MDYRFDIIHIPGATNVLPDHLSRIYADHRWGEGRGAHLFVRAATQPVESSISPPNLHGAGGGKGPGKNGGSGTGSGGIGSSGNGSGGID